MKKTADSYGRVLFELGIPREAVIQARELLAACPELEQALSNPAVTREEKRRIIDRIFPQETRSFLKVLCDNGHMNEIHQVDEAYERNYLESRDIIKARLFYAGEPDEEQLAALKQKIMKKYKKAGVNLVLQKDPQLLGGFVLRIGDEEYDRSVKGRLDNIYKKLAWR